MQHMTPANYSAKVIHGEYYPHIDGIRAFAVLPVVLFHILASLCPGGFAGVDVFFVISGYLITGGILRDLQHDSFTIRNFYHRRIRRIMPAYFALIAGVFATGCALYYAAPLILLGDAVTAGTLFVANLHFWMMGSDYFAPQLHSQALLHLWSLSVEEQFYLFIPVLCAIIWKFRRNWLMPTLATLTALSFAGAVYAVATGKTNNAFYFLHFRAWELLAGSLLAMLPAACGRHGIKAAEYEGGVAAPDTPGRRSASGNPAQSATRTSPGVPAGSHAALLLGGFDAVSRFLAPVGLLMVLIPYAVMSSKTPFPGLAALSSVLGTVLLIRYGAGGWIGRLLAWRPLVATGKISYSLYLWHWPVTVFWKYAVYDQLYWYDYAGMFLLSLLLGALSWRFVEVPVRTSQAWTMRRSFGFATAGIVLLVCVGTACAYYVGWPKMLHPQANKIARLSESRDPFVIARSLGLIRRAGAAVGYEFSWITTHEQQKKDKKIVDRFEGYVLGEEKIGCRTSQPILFILGDSHAGSLLYGMDKLLTEKGIPGYLISVASTNMFDINNQAANNALKTLSEMPSVKYVVLVEYWTFQSPLEKSRSKFTPESLLKSLKEYARKIELMGKQLVIISDIPRYPFIHADFGARSKIIPLRDIKMLETMYQQSQAEYDEEQGEINKILDEVYTPVKNVTIIPLRMAFWEGGRFTAAHTKNGIDECLYIDPNHLSKAGSLRAARFIMPYLFPEAGKKVDDSGGATGVPAAADRTE